MTRRVIACAVAMVATAGAATAAGPGGIDQGTARKAIGMCERLGARLVALDVQTPFATSTTATVRCLHDDGTTVDLAVDLPPLPTRTAAPAKTAGTKTAATKTGATKPQQGPAPVVLRQADIDRGTKSDAASQACYARYPGAQPIGLDVDPGGGSGTIRCRKVDVYGADPNPIFEFTIPFTVSG